MGVALHLVGVGLLEEVGHAVDPLFVLHHAHLPRLKVHAAGREDACACHLLELGVLHGAVEVAAHGATRLNGPHHIVARVDGLGCPRLEEAKRFLLAVTLVFLQETGVLDVEHVAGLVEHHKHGEPKPLRTAKALHQGLRLLCRLAARVVVDMDIGEVVGHQLGYLGVALHKIGEAQAPRAPVATHLADHQAAFALGAHGSQGTVDLGHGIDGLVIHSLQRRLRTGRQGDQCEQQRQCYFLHVLIAYRFLS